MRKAVALSVWFAAIGVAISVAPALAQQADSEPEFVLPESPTGLPGAIFRDQNGKHVFFAPGETVKLTDAASFVVKLVMEEGYLDSVLVTGILGSARNFTPDSAAVEAAKQA